MIYCFRYFNVLLVNGKISNDCVMDYLKFILYCLGGIVIFYWSCSFFVIFNVFCIFINENEINI